MKRSLTAEEPLVDMLFPQERLHDLLRESDYVVLTIPLTNETRHIIDEPALRAMKRTAYLVNVSRGGVVVEEALVKALQERRIAGAILDVFEREPLPLHSPLWEMDNVLITPHMAGNSERYMERITTLFANNLRRYLSGEALINIVDISRGY